MTQKRFNIIDSAGNRSSVAADATVSYSVNGLNQYTGITPGPGSQLAYDTNGIMIQKGADTYTWDYNNRMTGATIGSKNITYMYNYNDLRISKDVLVGATYVLTRYYYNGSKLFAEGDGTKITKTYTNDNEGVLGMTRKIYDNVGAFSHYQRLYYLFDNLGSVAAVTNETGKPVQYYQYDAYGRITNAVIDPVNSLTFVGRYYGQKDWDTGFTYFWHRWYDADMGRWISRDPIGVKGGESEYSNIDIVEKHIDVNPYNYTSNRPEYFIDSSGLCPDTCLLPHCFVVCGCEMANCICVSISTDSNLSGDLTYLFPIEMRSVIDIRVYSCDEFNKMKGGNSTSDENG
jgi:RHS repeat-associated protein